MTTKDAQPPGIRVPWVALGVVVSVMTLAGSFLIRINAGDATTELRLTVVERRLDRLEQEDREDELDQQRRLELLSQSLVRLQLELAALSRGGGGDATR